MPKTLHLLLVLGLLLSLAAFPAAHVFAQDPNAPIVRITQVDNSQFPQVTVYVSVTNAAGEPVAVDPSTIEVYENGQLMQASTVSDQGQIGTVTTLLAIDTSGSMEKGNKMQAARDAAKAYIDQMRPGDQAAVISFNTQVTVVQPVTGDQAALLAAVDSLRPVGNTAMFDALVQGVDVLKDVQGRKAIILLSDGLDNRSQATADDVINTIGPAGLSISTIGLGDPSQSTNNWGLDEAALKSLAERAGEMRDRRVGRDHQLAARGDAAEPGGHDPDLGLELLAVRHPDQLHHLARDLAHLHVEAGTVFSASGSFRWRNLSCC